MKFNICKETENAFVVTFNHDKTSFELSATEDVSVGTIPASICVIHIIESFNKLNITDYDYDELNNLFSNTPKFWSVKFGTATRTHNPETEELANQVWPYFLDCLKMFTDKYNGICGVSFPATTTDLRNFFIKPETRLSIEDATGFKYLNRNGYTFYFKNPAVKFPINVREAIQMALDSGKAISDKLKQDLEKILPIV